jgi:hypothetical protein
MTDHPPTITHAYDKPTLPNQPFFSWLRTHTALFIGQIIGLLSVVSFLVAFVYNARNAGLGLNLDVISRFVVYAHLPFLVVFIGALILMLENNTRGRYRAGLVYEKLRGKNKDRSLLEEYSEKQVRKFKHRFLGFWCAMLLLYLAFAFQEMFASPSTEASVIGRLSFPFLIFTLNNGSLLFIFSCFVVMYLPPEATPPDSPNPDEKPVDAKAVGAKAVDAKAVDAKAAGTPDGKKQAPQFLGFIGRTVQKFSSTPLEELQLRQRTLVVVAIFLVGLLTLAFPVVALTGIVEFTPNKLNQYPAVFDALSGTINAVVLALLIARLDSKLIALPSWLICILYFYAGVQPLFVVFELQADGFPGAAVPNVYAGIKTAVFIVVFIFKIYFFLIIIYSLQTGRMFNYFFCSGILNDHVRKLKAQRVQVPSEPKPEPEAASGKPDEHHSEKVSNDQDSSRTDPSQVQSAGQDRQLTWSKWLGGLAIVSFAGSLLYYAADLGDEDLFVTLRSVRHTVTYLHVPLLLIICITVLRARYKINKENPPPGNGALKSREAALNFKRLSERKFKSLNSSGLAEIANSGSKDLSALTDNHLKPVAKYFLLFWISLLFLYLALSAAAYREPGKASALSRTLNGSSAIVLKASEGAQKATALQKSQDWAQQPADKKGVVKTDEKSRQQSEPEKRTVSPLEMLLTIKLSLLCLLLNNLTVLSVFWCFKVLYVPCDDAKFKDKNRLLFAYSWLIAVLLTVLPPLLTIVIRNNGFTESEVPLIPTIFAALGGTLNAVAFALLIARLDSRVLGLPSTVISVLYGYAALQPLFVTFNQQSPLLEAIATSAVVAAFLFKICVVLIVAHVWQSRGLSDYLWFFPILKRSVNSVFDNQFEIRAYCWEPAAFTFSIFNKNIEIYKTETTYLTRAQCDDAVEKLVKRMKKKKSYEEPIPVHGTYWVQVTSLDGNVICESTSLRTKAEAEELIEESIEMVPYCKYDRG